MKEYYAKYQIIEIRDDDNKKIKDLNLALLNTGEKIKESKKIKKIKNQLNRDEILRIKKQRKLEKIERKKENKEEKKLTKILKKEKVKKMKAKKSSTKKLITKINKKPCKILLDCDIDEISDFIKNSGKNKDYPDITQK